MRAAFGLSPGALAAGGAPPPTYIGDYGTMNASSGNSGILTTLIDGQIGDLVVVGIMNNTARTFSSGSDTSSNTYTPTTGYVSTVDANFRLNAAYCRLTAPIAAGQTATFTLSGSCGKIICAQLFRNIAPSPLDLTGAGVSTTSAAPATASPGTPAQPVELIVGMTAITGGEATLLTADAAFSNKYEGTRVGFGKLAMSSLVITNGVAPARSEILAASLAWMARDFSWKAL